MMMRLNKSKLSSYYLNRRNFSKVEITLVEYLQSMEGRFEKAQTELKSELRNAQLAQEGRFVKAQTENRKDLRKNIHSNNYKLLFMFASLAVFESVGVFIEYPWRPSPRASHS